MPLNCQLGKSHHGAYGVVHITSPQSGFVDMQTRCRQHVAHGVGFPVSEDGMQAPIRASQLGFGVGAPDMGLDNLADALERNKWPLIRGCRASRFGVP